MLIVEITVHRQAITQAIAVAQLHHLAILLQDQAEEVNLIF